MAEHELDRAQFAADLRRAADKIESGEAKGCIMAFSWETTKADGSVGAAVTRCAFADDERHALAVIRGVRATLDDFLKLGEVL